MVQGMTLLEWRRKSNLSQRAAGRLIGVTDMSWSRYESGAVIPKREIMERIIKATRGKVTPNDFYHQKGTDQ